MKKVFLLSLLAVVFFGCQNNDPDFSEKALAIGKEPTANFTYKTAHPLKAIFENRSENADTYKWDFGDGTYSTEVSPTHRYSSMGVYKVRLCAISGEYKNYFETNVKVENPTKCYFAGVTYIKLSVNNKYVRFKLLDDDFFRDTWATSTWELLSTANLPFQYTFKDPVLLSDLNSIDYFTLELYSNSSTSGNGSKIDALKITTSTLKTYPEELVTSDKTSPNQIKVQFIWK